MAEQTFTMHPVAHIESDFAEKFGIPRQSGLVDALRARVVFEPPYRDPSALRGIEQFSHIWLLWQFTQAMRSGWSPTVRPPRLGGNTRVGVFATRSPFRPNPIGLSSVRLLAVERDPELGTVLRIAGADLMDGTPVLDIKPYVPYVDSHPEAAGGFASAGAPEALAVEISPELLEPVPEELRPALLGVLAQDPRPPYQDDPERVYGLDFGGFNVKFTVSGDRLQVRQIQPDGRDSRL